MLLMCLTEVLVQRQEDLYRGLKRGVASCALLVTLEKTRQQSLMHDQSRVLSVPLHTRLFCIHMYMVEVLHASCSMNKCMHGCTNARVGEQVGRLMVKELMDEWTDRLVDRCVEI